MFAVLTALLGSLAWASPADAIRMECPLTGLPDAHLAVALSGDVSLMDGDRAVASVATHETFTARSYAVCEGTVAKLYVQRPGTLVVSILTLDFAPFVGDLGDLDGDTLAPPPAEERDAEAADNAGRGDDAEA